MTAAMPRRVALGAVLAAAASAAVPGRSAAGPAAAKGTHIASTLRGDDTPRLPDHAALWARMPLPFTPAEAWRLLTPETQAEIGAAVIGMALSDYVSGDMHVEEADHFHDDDLRCACRDARDEILSGLDARLWAIFPDLYGPDGDHPRWALDAGMVLPLGVEAPEPLPIPTQREASASS